MNDILVYKTLSDAAEKWPDLPAVHDEFGTLSFKELFIETETLKFKLKTLGIAPGMGVGVMARNGRNFISAIFAVVGCGAVVMPISNQLKKSELDTLLSESKLNAILDDRHGVAPVEVSGENIKMSVESFRFAFTSVSKKHIFAPHVKDAAFIRFTSGTTGKSKGVVISNKSAIERVDAANKVLKLGTNDTVIWVLPIAYHFVVSILLYIRYGAAIAIAKNFLPKNIIDITNAHNGTLLYASPMQIRLLANNTNTDGMPSLKRVISTSAAISTDICIAYKKRFGMDVSQAYGIIEIGLPLINHVKSEEHPEAVGYALPDYNVAILDDNYNPLPPGKLGRLGINGPGMFDAYLSPPVLRKDVLKNGYFLTADFATMSADGLVKVEGREKSVINVSGNKVFPEEVEGVLETIPEIKLARISGAPHQLMGQIIQAEVILHEGKTIDEEDVLTYCRKRLSTYKIPQRIKVVTSLPMTGSGKLQRY
ncbi:class I adenylate-forming enzyme family protein [Aurantibacillus circumpalustris]|uniref:class I adenylate-forming enzyme family protein n=1 Tax=Aurantibacillus circumpalustris TaxID=3036359 RepID=UPI00295B37E3|nr:class I adenylate-forming enzyme family protein [Aurantibacillus circumpalustris]